MTSQSPTPAPLDVVRTPEERFAAISDYPWTPQYAEVGSPGDDICPGPLRMILGRADGPLIAHVPGAQGQPHDRLVGGHFVQEDVGPELAAGIVDLVQRTG